MHKRETMGISRYLMAWMLSVLMFFFVADITGFENITVKAEETAKVIAVTQNGTTTEYASFAEWRPDGSVEDSCTIKLLADTSTTDVLKFSEGTFYLDLNGHTLDVGNNGVFITSSPSTNVIIEDNSGKKSGKLTGSNTSYNTVAIYSGSCTVKDGVTVENTRYGSAISMNGDALTIEEGARLEQRNNYGSLYVIRGRTDIKGGTLKGPLHVSGEVHITGGTFQSGIKIENNGIKAADCMEEGYCLKKADGSYYLDMDTKNINESVTAAVAPVKVTGHPKFASEDAVALVGYKDAPQLTVTAEKQGNLESGNLSYTWYLRKTPEGGKTEADSAIPDSNRSVYQIPTGLPAGIYTYYCRVTCGKYYVNTQIAAYTVSTGNVGVKIGEEETAYTAMQPALAAVGEAVKADTSDGSLDVVITLKNDIEVNQYNTDAVNWVAEASGKKKINITFDLNGKTIGYKDGSNWKTGNLTLTVSRENAAITLKDSSAGESGKLKGSLNVQDGAKLTVENGEYVSAYIRTGSEGVFKQGKCTSELYLGEASSLESEDGAVCEITDGYYQYVNACAGTKLAISGINTKISSLYVRSNSLVSRGYEGKRARVELSGGSYNKIGIQTRRRDELLDETNGYAIADMLSPGYDFFYVGMKKTVYRAELYAENVEVLPSDTKEDLGRAEVELVCNGTDSSYYENWQSVLEYLYSNRTEIKDCRTVDIILRKDITYSGKSSNVIRFGNAKVTLRSGEGGPYTLTGNGGELMLVGDANDFRIEDINLKECYLHYYEGNFAVKDAVLSNESGYALLAGNADMSQTLTLESGAKIISGYSYATLAMNGNAVLRVESGAVVENTKNSERAVVIYNSTKAILEKDIQIQNFLTYNEFAKLDLYCKEDMIPAVTGPGIKRKWYPLTLPKNCILSESEKNVTSIDDQLFGCAEKQIGVGKEVCSWYPTAEDTTGSQNIQRITGGKFTMPAVSATLLGHKPDKDKEDECGCCNEIITAEVTVDETTTYDTSIKTAFKYAKTQTGSVILLRNNDAVFYGEKLEITDGISLIIPAGKTLTNDSVITNNGTIIIADPGCFAGGGSLKGNGTFEMKPDFAEDDITVPMGLTYTGDDLTESAGAAISFAESKKSVTVMKKEFFTDTAGWDYTITRDGKEADEIRNAGEYMVVYSNGDSAKSIQKPFTVAKAAIPTEVPEDADVANGIVTVCEAAGIVLGKDSGWSFDADTLAKTIPAGDSIKVMAHYVAADKECYETTDKEITITRAACEEDKTVLYTGEGEMAPTCTKAGTGHTECRFCHAVMNGNISVAAVSHSLTNVPAKEATETENGNTAHYVCSVCQKYFSDEAAQNEITDKTSVIIPVKEVTPAEQPGTGSTEKPEQPDTETTENTGQSKPAPKKKGTKFKDAAGNQYKVTGSDKKNPTVEYVKPKSNAKGNVKIPATARYAGVTYKVTSIADKAFRNNKKVTNITVGTNVKSIGRSAFEKCTKLKTVTVGKNVTKIGKNAFGGCKNLKRLTIKSAKLTKKGLASGSFKGITKKTVVKVPKGKVKAYKKLLQSKGLDKKVKVK